MSDSMRPSRRDEPDETELRGLAEDLVCHWEAMPGVTEATHQAITRAIHALAKWLDGETDGNAACQSSHDSAVAQGHCVKPIISQEASPMNYDKQPRGDDKPPISERERQELIVAEQRRRAAITDPKRATMCDTELREIIELPFLALAREFGWDDRQFEAARKFIDITVIRLEEREKAPTKRIKELEGVLSRIVETANTTSY